MDKLEIVSTKLEFCSCLLEYKKCSENNYKLIDDLNGIFDSYNSLGVFNGIKINRADTIIHNKLSSTLKEFIKRDIDPVFFFDQASNEYYPGNFYTRYILLYLSDIINELHECLDRMVDELSVFTGNVEKLTKQYWKMLLSVIRGGNMILSDKKCLDGVSKILEEYKHYQELLDKLYEFDIRDDYLSIVRMNLARIFNEANRDKMNFENAIFIQYSIDLDYLKKMGKMSEQSALKDMYIEHLNSFGMNQDILNQDVEPYFSKISPESEELLEYTKLSTDELRSLVEDLASQRLELLCDCEFTGDAPKDIARLMLLASELFR